jgi:hypothetical protein
VCNKRKGLNQISHFFCVCVYFQIYIETRSGQRVYVVESFSVDRVKVRRERERERENKSIVDRYYIQSRIESVSDLCVFRYIY